MVRQTGLAVLAFSTLAMGQATQRSAEDDLTLYPTPVEVASGAHDALVTRLYWDNDSRYTKPENPSDRHYTAGIGAAVQWQSPETRDLVGALPSLDGEFDPARRETSYSMGAIVSQRYYTPSNLWDSQPIYDDWPYAGWLYGGLIMQRANRIGVVPVFEHFEVDMGTIGPASQTGHIQRWLHARIGDQVPQGWQYQIKDEFGADFKYLRRWRMTLAQESLTGTPGVEVIPEAGFTAGSMHVNANAGATLRVGWNLPDDFGPDRMNYPGDFTRPLSPTNPLGDMACYFYVRPGGRAVGHDSTIDGSYFHSSPVEQNSEVLVAEIQTGFVIQFFKHFELGYSQTFTSPQFIHQSNWDIYGSITLSYVCTW